MVAAELLAPEVTAAREQADQFPVRALGCPANAFDGHVHLSHLSENPLPLNAMPAVFPLP